MRIALLSVLVVLAALNGCSNHDDAKSPPVNPAQTVNTLSTPPVTGPPGQTKIGKDYVFKGAGVLRLTFPKTWADSPNRIMVGTEPVNVIEFVPFNGNNFQVHLEIRNLGESITKAFDIRASLNQAGMAEITNCVEQSLDIHEFQGPEATGGYYTVADKQPLPGEYKYLTQGYAKLAGILLKFRLVSNQIPGKEVDDTVKMIESAHFSRR